MLQRCFIQIILYWPSGGCAGGSAGESSRGSVDSAKKLHTLETNISNFYYIY